MPCLSNARGPLLAAIALFSSLTVSAATVPLRVDFPPGSSGPAVPVAGGIPLPVGALRDTKAVKLTTKGGTEVPCQVTRQAVWPDGSIKWAMVDAILKPGEGDGLILHYGAGVTRAKIQGGIRAAMKGDNADVQGGGVSASVSMTGGGVAEALKLGGKTVVSADRPARLVINALRMENGTQSGGGFLLTNTFVCRDPKAKLQTGSAKVTSVTVESPGPVRATILIRGYVALPGFGATLPKKVLASEPAGRLPFSMRLSFYKDIPVVYGQHQIIFSGEPDCDFIARWGIELPGLAGARGTTIIEPGVELHMTGGKTTVCKDATRLCWAPIKEGFAQIIKGWHNRPCAVTQEKGSAWIDFWPESAGLWDLRRYAREWAVGESGDMRKPEQIKRYAQFAARGLAKSHNFVIRTDAGALAGNAPGEVKALSGRALLIAPSDWYASTGVLGPLAPEQVAGEYASLDAASRRALDYHLYCQDLYRWHGKLEYGFWQTRFGQIHRHDRWDNDYGRWGWSLNDGGGRVGHVLMLQFLRTLERRYFDAGEALNRINYDTNMVHTERHLENCRNWWVARGCSHRHNVQPFGCPYIGMRGSNPGGQRILHLLTGDGVIADGLDIVSDAGFKYVNGQSWRLCNSGGSDGQGSASMALLWKYETTGEKKYLDACRAILDKSGLIPPKGGKRLGYGPSFGLFNAAGEYALLSGDTAFQNRVVQVARLGAKAKKAGSFLNAIALGLHFSKDAALKTKLGALLKKMSGPQRPALQDLPVERWPGHAGWITPTLAANQIRDYPSALGVLLKSSKSPAWPKIRSNLKPLPAERPTGWYKPGGAQVPTERRIDVKTAKGWRAGTGGGTLKAGPATWTASDALANQVVVADAALLSAPISGYVDLIQAGTDSRQAVKAERLQGGVSGIGSGPGGALLGEAKTGAAKFKVRLGKSKADGVDSIRLDMTCNVPNGSGRVASWGLLVPLKLGKNGFAIMTTAPGAFRLERCRLNQNDEKVPSWLAAMERREKLNHWPLWRRAGIEIGPGSGYRIWHAAEDNVAPVFVDQGEGTSNWFDVTDRGGKRHWGVTARILRATPIESDASRQAVRVNLETGLLEIQFHSAASEPLAEAVAAPGLSGSVDLIFHDGWRPPLSKPELNRAQWEKFVADLNYGENYGLFALRFRLSTTHKVRGKQWMDRIRDLGIEPRELLYSMQYRDVLAKHAAKVGVKWDGRDVEGSVKRIIEHYK